MPADRPGERAFLNITPFPEYYKIDNRVMTTPQGSEPRTVSINREPGSNQLTFWGNIPQDDPGFGEALAIEDPADFSARLFRAQFVAKQTGNLSMRKSFGVVVLKMQSVRLPNGTAIATRPFLDQRCR